MTVTPSDTTGTITIPITFTGANDIHAYTLDMAIAGESGATGVAFKTPNNAVEATTGYVFAGDDFGLTNYNSDSSSSRVYLDDSRNSFANVTYTDVAKNTAVLSLVISNPHIGDKFDVTFNSSTVVYKWDAGSFGVSR